jgi:small subunit ribosomal protein S21
VNLRPDETNENLYRRFLKSVASAATLSYVRRKRWHIPPSEVRRMEKKKAMRRARRRQLKQDGYEQ